MAGPAKDGRPNSPLAVKAMLVPELHRAQVAFGSLGVVSCACVGSTVQSPSGSLQRVDGPRQVLEVWRCGPAALPCPCGEERRENLVKDILAGCTRPLGIGNVSRNESQQMPGLVSVGVEIEKGGTLR